MSTLRSSIFLDRLQPQLMCLLGSTARGFLPRHNDAAMLIEVAPGDFRAIWDSGTKDRSRTHIQFGKFRVARP